MRVSIKHMNKEVTNILLGQFLLITSLLLKENQNKDLLLKENQNKDKCVTLPSKMSHSDTLCHLEILVFIPQ